MTSQSTHDVTVHVAGRTLVGLATSGLDAARNEAWKGVAYYATDPETEYTGVGYAIRAICQTCHGLGWQHAKRRFKTCKPGWHRPECKKPCECQGEPYQVVEQS